MHDLMALQITDDRVDNLVDNVYPREDRDSGQTRPGDDSIVDVVQVVMVMCECISEDDDVCMFQERHRPCTDMT